MRLGTSGIKGAGKGVFAMQPFKRGELITGVHGTLFLKRSNAFVAFSLYAVEDEINFCVKPRELEDNSIMQIQQLKIGLGMFANSINFTVGAQPNVMYISIKDDNGKWGFFLKATRDIYRVMV